MTSERGAALAAALLIAAVGCGDDTAGGGGSAAGAGGAGGGSSETGAGGGGSTGTGGAPASSGGGGAGSAAVEPCMFVGGRLEGARSSDLRDRNEAGGGCGHADIGGSPVGYTWDVVLDDGEELTVFLDIAALDDGVVGGRTARFFVAGHPLDPLGPDPLWESELGACFVFIESNELEDLPEPYAERYDFVGTVTCDFPADGPEGAIYLAGEIRFSNSVYHSPF